MMCISVSRMNTDEGDSTTFGVHHGAGHPSASGEGPAGESSIPPWFISYLNGGEGLAPEVQAVVDDVIAPLYRKMVVEEADPILRAAGITVVTAHTLALLEEPTLFKAASRACAGDDDDRAEYERIVSRYLKTARESSRTMNLHLSLRRAKFAKWVLPVGPPGLMRKIGVGI